jgi:vacuolar-type H+-ATPase subunit E/Vma4
MEISSFITMQTETNNIDDFNNSVKEYLDNPNNDKNNYPALLNIIKQVEDILNDKETTEKRLASLSHNLLIRICNSYPMFKGQKTSKEDDVWIQELTLMLDRVLKDDRYKDQKSIRGRIYGLY